MMATQRKEISVILKCEGWPVPESLHTRALGISVYVWLCVCTYVSLYTMLGRWGEKINHANQCLTTFEKGSGSYSMRAN